MKIIIMMIRLLLSTSIETIEIGKVECNTRTRIRQATGG